MKISNHGYVTIKIQQSLLDTSTVIGTPTGKTRVRADGKVEAEFLCLRRSDSCETVWATKEQLVTPTKQT
jgi:hypothetical protein